MTPREIVVTALNYQKILGFDVEDQVVYALHVLAASRKVSGVGGMILKAAARRLREQSTVAQWWARGEWDEEVRNG